MALTKRLQATVLLLCLAPFAIAQTTGSIAGKVTDVSGAPILGAVVTIAAADGKQNVTATDSDGAFEFSSLKPGAYNVRISANGLSDWTASNVPASAKPGSTPLLAVLQVARAKTEVTVGVPPEEVAAAQLTQELKQRAFGVIPNYYVTYESHPAPLSAKQKLHLGVRTLVDPVTFGVAGITAGIQQERNSYHQWGQGVEGFAKRYGATYATAANGILITAVLMDSLLHQDPRYFYSGQGTRAQRAWYALRTAFLAKGDNGKWQPPYSDLIGLVASAEIAQTYYPGSRTQYTLLGRSLMFRFAGRIGVNLAQELLLKKVTSNVRANQLAADIPVLREGTPVFLIAVDGLTAEGVTTGNTLSFVLARDVLVDGNVVAKAGDIATGQVGRVSVREGSGEASSVGLERVTLREGNIAIPLRSSQIRGSVAPMQYKQLPQSEKIAVTLYVAENVSFPALTGPTGR
ncbi:MAG: carboxypeptidase regulatory-like domain-containing protein [Acidobacteriaceae bacterium]|nr:carboxypeptidase regulatory-like domain-containing protein [Acidobacteriaceae bacterium]